MSKKVVFCNCTYAQVIPEKIKKEVLGKLTESGIPFEAVPDLCRFSSTKNPKLVRFAESEDLKVIACYPRAVKWLFQAGDAPLKEDQSTVFNMRKDPPEKLKDIL